MALALILVFLVGFGAADFGVRRQSEAVTALWIGNLQDMIQSGVALRLPPHSKGQSSKIETTFDPLKNLTTVRLQPVQISSGKSKYHSLHFAVAYTYSGRPPQQPRHIDFELTSVVKARKLKIDIYVVFVLDGEPIFLSSNRSPIKNPVRGRRWVGERLAFRMPYETLLKITKAQKFAIKMDETTFEVGEREIDALREFVAQMEQQ